MLLQTPNTVAADTLYMIGSVAGGTAVVVLFLERRFSDIRKLVYRIISAHNREDDDRFAQLRSEIHQINTRNAKKDGSYPPELKEFRRRRYLDDEPESIVESGG